MASNQPNVFIDDEAGTTGLGIRRRLEMMPRITLRSLPAAHRRDLSARRDMMAACDLVVLCLPDDAAREAAALAGALGADAPKLLDASTAHRVDPEWTYGFPEMAPGQPAEIATSRKVANPGCYPTGAIGLLRPLVEAGLVSRDYPIAINAVTGYSGGGRSMIEAHDREGGPAFAGSFMTSPTPWGAENGSRNLHRRRRASRFRKNVGHRRDLRGGICKLL
jgi:N-acetyl-gamma-glutamyl-phosphate reductase